jgi:MFS family permease
MLQEIFGGRLIGLPVGFDQLTRPQLAQVSAMGAGFAGLLSLFNIAGRFFWATLSDHLGRQRTYTVFFLVGAALYAAVPWTGHAGHAPLFVAIVCLILTMYGGGFAAIPAYLADLFGTQMVGAIHGRLLTAWSVAGVLGPVLVKHVNEYQVRAGVPRASAYDTTMYLLASLLIVGLVCNLRIRPVPEHRFVSETFQRDASRAAAAVAVPSAGRAGVSRGLVIPFWLLVGIPLAWGAWTTLRQTWTLLQSAR